MGTEIKTVRINGRLTDRKRNKAIADMERKGWTHVDAKHNINS